MNPAPLKETTLSVPIALASRVAQTPSLDDPSLETWKTCRPFDDFRMQVGDISQPTRALLGYDDHALYLAFVMREDSLDRIRTDTTKRTRDIDVQTWINKDDSIQVLIDPRRDGVNYRHFLVNPAGKWMTSRGKGSPEATEADYDWTPGDWTFKTTVESDRWSARMRIAASDLGLESFRDGQLLGVDFIRERVPEPHETSSLARNSLANATHWTSHLSYEPSQFGALALGNVTETPKPFPVTQWHGPERPAPAAGVTLLPPALGNPAAPRALPVLAGKNLWCIHSRLAWSPGLEKSRLAPFEDDFGWQLSRDVTKDLDMHVPEGREWMWWFSGLDEERMSSNAWTIGISEEKIANTIFTLDGRRYTRGQCLPPYRNLPPVARKGLDQLVEKFGDRFVGLMFSEWDSDIWSVATGMHETPEWLAYPEDTPTASGSREDEEKTLRREWDLFRKLSFDYVVPLNCWRCVDHYALEWGARAACIEITGAGNPSALTQLAFARGAARQYGTYFITYLATFLAADYTKYEGGLEFIPSHEGVYAAGPDSGPSKYLYRRLLFTTYLSGTTVQSLEHPQMAHVMPAEKEGEYELSPHGEAMADLLEYHNRYEDRGVPYQPVALLLDYLHGFSPPYQTCCAIGRSGMQTWFSVPYDRGDHQLYQTFRTIFPWCRQEIERNGFPLTNTPFGDIFDVLVANPPSGAVSQDVLGGYRVAVLVGTIRYTDQLKRRLLDYVKAGGTLVANSLNMHDLPGELKGGSFIFESAGVAVTRKVVGAGAVIATPASDLLDESNKALPALGHILATIAHEVAPVEVRGDVQYHFLKTKAGWLVALMNNKGIVHVSPEKPRYQPNEKAEVQLLSKQSVEKSIERVSGAQVPWECSDGARVARVTIDPGDIKIVEVP